ncbi:hypothetical protein C0993_009538, partial [Termitomyces sp. T159_Od127]
LVKVTSMPSSFSSVYTAEVSQASASHAPIIGRGTIGPLQLDSFEYSAKRYFSHKGIPVDKQVKKVLYNIDSSEVWAWVREKEEELKGEDERFAEWASNLWEANDTLINNKRFYILTEKLCDHLLLHCLDDLRMEYMIGNKDDCYDGIKEFSKWLKMVGDLDTALVAWKAQISKQWAAAVAASTKTHLKNILNSSKAQPNKGTAATQDNPTASADTRMYMYPLTGEERKLLDKHRGCYQCRRVYVDHRLRECSDKGTLLTLAEYEKCKLTPAFVEAARKEYMGRAESSRTGSSKGQKGVSVVAVFKEESEEESSSDAGSEYVLPQHITYPCHVSGPSLKPIFVEKVLIDTGSPPALISETLTTRLGVPVYRLSKPLAVSGAFAKDGSKEETLVLSTYVKLVIVSPCSNWESRSQVFIVCPNLHTELILGLPFLRRNKLIVDASEGCVVDKKTGFDLLHPENFQFERVEKPVEPHVKRRLERKAEHEERESIQKGQKEMEGAWQLVHFELNALFARKSDRFGRLQENTVAGESVLVGLVRARIEELAFKEKLKRMDARMKRRFEAQFPPDIPHADELPDSVYHRIQVKPLAKITVARSYSCPRKYREGWKTLIDQHAAAGRIRPSSSPYASPSFVIPKLDPMFLTTSRCLELMISWLTVRDLVLVSGERLT